MNMKYGLWAILVVVCASIVAGLWFVDSPSQVRAERFDQIRVNHLQNIQSSVLDSWNQRKVLPGTLSDITGYNVQIVTADPVTHVPYEYSVIDTQTFRLCATFVTSSTLNNMISYPYSYPMQWGGASIANSSWDHAAGHVCFDRHFEIVPIDNTQGPLPVVKPIVVQ